MEKHIDWNNISTFGSMSHGILQEKVWRDLDYKAMLHLIDEFGLPADTWNDIFLMKKILVIDINGQGLLVDRKDVPKNILDEYPEPFDFKSWVKRKAEQLEVDTTQDIEILKKNYTKLKKSKGKVVTIGDDDIAVTLKNILKHYRNDGLSWLTTVRNEIQFEEDFFTEYSFLYVLTDLKKQLETNKKFIETANWLAMQFGYNEEKPFITKLAIADRELSKIEYSIISNDNLDEVLRWVEPIEMAAVSTGVNLEQYLAAIKENSKIVELSPVNISEGWDAGFITPDGVVYAMNGPDSAFIHAEIADLAFEQFNIVEDPKFIGKDFQLMSEMNWLKFNKQKILYDGFMAKELGYTMTAGLTEKQKDRLVEYLRSTPNKRLYLGMHGKCVTEEEFLSLTDEQLEDLFNN